MTVLHLRNIYGLNEQRSCNLSTVVSHMHFYAFSLEGHLSFDSSRQGNEAISSFIELRLNIIVTLQILLGLLCTTLPR